MEDVFNKYYNYLDFLLKVECENQGKKYEEVKKGSPASEPVKKKEPEKPKVDPLKEDPPKQDPPKQDPPEKPKSPYDLEFVDGYYKGETKNGLMHGHGVRHFNKSGSDWEGKWQEGKANGLITITLHGVEVFKGEMKDDLRNGEGRFIIINKRQVYEGDFKNDTFDGKGCLYDEEGQIIYQGEWKNGKKHGRGKAFYSNGQCQYDGNWKDNLYDGQGIAYDINGKELYSGQWKNGNPADENARLESAASN